MSNDKKVTPVKKSHKKDQNKRHSKQLKNRDVKFLQGDKEGKEWSMRQCLYIKDKDEYLVSGKKTMKDRGITFLKWWTKQNTNKSPGINRITAENNLCSRSLQARVVRADYKYLEKWNNEIWLIKC